MLKRSIVWFRLDLRLHDNEALTEALKSTHEVLPVYIFDRRLFEQSTRYGFRKTGIHRARFLIESVSDLRSSLRAKGSDLVVRVGHPEDEIYRLAKQLKSSWIFCNRERTRDEVRVQDGLEKKLWSIGQEMRYSRGKMLYYTQDLPFPVTHTPDTFASFRKEVENYTPIRSPLAEPKEILRWTKDIDPGSIPSLEDLGYHDQERDPRADMIYCGGASEALQRMATFFWEIGDIDHYDETQNELVDCHDSSRFSPWISHGCLSPKTVYKELLKLKEAGRNAEAINLFFLQLLWRDYHRLMGKKYENQIFLKGGTKGVVRSDLGDHFDLLDIWINGETGVPLVDACMNELKATGYLSRRGRELVSSFLINELKVNWQMGAEYFESILIDYDPCSNYGNWNLVAGIGSNNRRDPVFNLAAQARKLDPKGDYIKLWADKYHTKTVDELNTMHEVVLGQKG